MMISRKINYCPNLMDLETDDVEVIKWLGGLKNVC
jgi:hypothetical protein